MYFRHNLYLFVFFSVVVLNCFAANSRKITSKIFLRKAARGVIMQKYMNTSVNPCDDFYEFACGNWPKINPKRKEIESYDTFVNMEDKIKANIIRLLNESTSSVSSSDGLNDVELKARLYYHSCIHSDIFNYRKIDDYVELINSIGGCPALNPHWQADDFDWVKMIAKAMSYGISILIDEDVSHVENGTLVMISKAKVGLLPLTLEDSEQSRAFRLNNLLIERIFTIYGVSKRKAGKLAMNVMQFMRKLLEAGDVSEDILQADDPRETAPLIDWEEYFRIIMGRQLDNKTEALLLVPQYIRRLNTLILRSDFQTVANYIAVKIIFALHPEYTYKKYPEQTCATLTNQNLEAIVSYMYMEKFYDKQSEQDIIEMTTNIKESFRKILETSEWLDAKTKVRALEKLNATQSEIGLKSLILSKRELQSKYENLTLHPTNFYQNNLRFQHFKNIEDHTYTQTETNTSSLNDWDLTVVEVNAYYLPEKNLMVIPAGIMLPPFYHPDLPKAFTYGIIGSVIGHELTHGFDDTGRLTDSRGDEVNWWSKKSSRAYERRAKCMIDQYSNYTMPDLNINIDGETTLDENIADNGGVRESFYAYKMWYERNDNETQRRNERFVPALNFTNTQVFFLSYAQAWCDSLVQTDLEQYLEDEHAMKKYRIIGALSNFEEFANEFKCPLGSKMNPVKKCRVW